MQYCFFVLLSHSLSVKLASHVHHFIARPLWAAPQGGGLISFPQGFPSLDLGDNFEFLAADPEKRRSHSLAWNAGYCSFLHRLQRRWFYFLCLHSAGGKVSGDQNALCFTAKEEEKQKLMKWSSELKLEREQLEQRVKQLSNSITVWKWPSSSHLRLWKRLRRTGT